MFACACTFLGIVVIALPVTVLGNHFGKEYEKEYMKKDDDNDDIKGEYGGTSRRGSFETELGRRTSFGSIVEFPMYPKSPNREQAPITPQNPRVLKWADSAPILTSDKKSGIGMISNSYDAKNLKLSDVEKAKIAIQRLEQMANDFQIVIQTMKSELATHVSTLSSKENIKLRSDTESSSIFKDELIVEEIAMTCEGHVETVSNGISEAELQNSTEGEQSY